MDIQEMSIEEQEKEWLKKKIIIGFERTRYTESDRPNLVIEGDLFNYGYRTGSLALEKKPDKLKSLQYQILGKLVIARAKKFGWRKEDINKTVNDGRQFAKDANRFKELTGQTPFETYAKTKIIGPIVASRNT